MIVTYRDDRIATVDAGRSGAPGRVASDAVLADNRYPDFVRPICAAARARGLPVVLDADRPTDMSDDAVPDRHARDFFGRMPARDDRTATILVPRSCGSPSATDAFLAVTNGAEDVLWLRGRHATPQPGLRRQGRRHARRPATCFTAPSRSRWLEGRETSSRRCALPPRQRRQMHAPRRQRRRADARRGRSAPRGGARVSIISCSADGHGAPHGAQAPAKSSGETRAADRRARQMIGQDGRPSPMASTMA